MYCPHVCQDDIPEELIEEVERTNNRDNGDVLTRYFNQVLFKDYIVLCSTGMREYFVLTAVDREKSFAGILRYSSSGRGR